MSGNLEHAAFWLVATILGMWFVSKNPVSWSTHIVIVGTLGIIAAVLLLNW